MAGRPTGDSPDQYGDVDWVDLSDNWTAAYAERIQERGVARVTNTPPSLTLDFLSNIAAGRLFFNTSTKALLISTDGTDTGIKTALISNALTATDSSTTVTLSINGQPGFTFTKSSGAVSIASMTIGSLSSTAGASGTFQTTSSGVEINTTGSNNIVLTTGASGLAVSGGLTTGGSVAITGGLTTTTASTLGAGLTVSSGNLTVSSGTLTVSAGSTSVQALTVNTTLGVTGAATLSNTLGVTGATTLSSTLAVTGAVTGSSTAQFTTGTFTGLVSPALTSPSGSDITVTIPTGRAVRWTAADGAAGVDVYYANTAARMAFVVTGTSLTATDYPEGTIWIS